ncbi:methyl-accepting chemotaxis protein [Deinococcus sp.]|uniref:methyl-accepting chemotaxis protein n=1 Tax=Deinococcus sp. TaxID=47478 RepID=UPI003B5A10AA
MTTVEQGKPSPELTPPSVRSPQQLSAPPEQGSWLNRISVAQKLGLTALAFGLPVAVLLGLLLQAQQRDLVVVRDELRGHAYLPVLIGLQENVQAHRRQSGVLLATPTAANRQAIEALERKIDVGIASLVAVNTNQGQGFELNKDISALKAAWTSIKTKVGNRSIDVPESTLIHSTFLNENIDPLYGKISDVSGLALDPVRDSYYLMNLVTNTLPQAIPIGGESMGDAFAAVSRQSITDVQKAALAVRLENTRRGQREVENAVQLARNASPVTANSLRQPAANLSRNVSAIVDTIETSVLAPAQITLPAGDYLGVTTPYVDYSYKLLSAASQTLGDILSARQASLQQARTISLVLVAAALLIGLAVLLAVARAINVPLRQLARAARDLGQGNLNVRVDELGTDEVGVLAKTFNQTAGQLRDNELRNAAERESAAKLQTNIGSFLDVTMDIAEGDLTKRGIVTEDVLGNVVDSINVMVAELEDVLRQVQGASNSVTQGAGEMLRNTNQIAQGTQTTAEQAGRVAGEVQGVNASIRRMADDAQASASTAQQALSASQQGQRAVESTLGGMQNIRREVQGISKRIKNLGDRSLEIQEIVDTISRISSQTNLLALNASIEAAGAGEAGSRFAVVADEVRKLAENSAQATGRIATLIKNVQAEVQEVVVSVEGGSREVEAGYRVATDAGARLAEIAGFAEQSAALARSISEAAQAQVQGVSQVGEAVNAIAGVSEQSRRSVNESRNAAEKLQQLAADLNSQLGRFRLSN